LGQRAKGKKEKNEAKCDQELTFHTEAIFGVDDIKWKQSNFVVS
jgi:hypothetical protein